MYTLYLLQFNNYYNRQIKRCATLDDYKSYLIHNGALDANGAMFPNVHFNMNNYVNTSQVIDWSGDIGDYLVVTQPGKEGEVIHSRWFVINSQKTREGQHILTLHRDVVTDYYDQTISAPCFIEKATPTSINDPAIFNSENMSFNQIKTQEILLPDPSGCQWAVAYIPRNAGVTGNVVNIQYKYEDEIFATYDSKAAFYLDLADKIHYTEGTLQDGSYIHTNLWDLGIQIPYHRISGREEQAVIAEYGPTGKLRNKEASLYQTVGQQYSSYNNSSFYHVNMPSSAFAYNTDLTEMSDYIDLTKTVSYKGSSYKIATWVNQLYQNYVDAPMPYSDVQVLDSYKGKIIKVGNDLFRVGLEMDYGGDGAIGDVEVGSDLHNIIKQGMPAIGTVVGTYSGKDYTVGGSYPTIYLKAQYTSTIVSLTSLTAQAYYRVPDKDSRTHLVDQPYDLLCFPYGDADLNITYVDTSGNTAVTKTLSSVQPDTALQAVTQLGLQIGSSQVYDVQLLPYCPDPGVITGNKSFDLTTKEAVVIYAGKSTDSGTKTALNVGFWCTLSTQSQTINIPIEDQTTLPMGPFWDIEEKKIANETTLFRLCSPNYAGYFDISPAKNTFVAQLQIIYQYKPFQPYIQVFPIFQDMYGKNFKDSRGLVCGGDFSLPIVTDAWADYQMNNKYYLDIFDRGTQNIEVNNAVQREQETWQVMSGALSAGVQGAAAGAMVAGPWGALAGVATAGASLAGGIRDMQLNETLRAEALDYRQDLFGYQLKTIQALPQSLARVSSISPVNKKWPFLEYYTCKPTEVQALKDKLKYNGYTIMRIGTINEFLLSNESYIKGQLIRPEISDATFSVVDALSGEIYKGVFISTQFTPALTIGGDN